MRKYFLLATKELLSFNFNKCKKLNVKQFEPADRKKKQYRLLFFLLYGYILWINAIRFANNEITNQSRILKYLTLVKFESGIRWEFLILHNGLNIGKKINVFNMLKTLNLNNYNVGNLFKKWKKYKIF